MERRDTEFRDKLRELFDSALPEDVQKKLTKKAQDLAYDFRDSVEWWIKDELSEQLSGYVQDMTDRAIESMLAGNEEMFRRYLKCEKGGWNGRDGEQHVIHGRLFEANSVELRRKLSEAFPDLLKNERVLDLEAQVAGLVVEVNKREAEIERLQQLRRDYA